VGIKAMWVFKRRSEIEAKKILETSKVTIENV
jgi:hypothetical protein